MRLTNAADIGKAIRQVRTSQGLTQPQLAAACGTGTRFIVDIEKGKPTCELEKTLTVLSMLGIVLDATAPELDNVHE
jgi:HTH-type transcriptional regulator / antitoxin HipB